MAEKLLKQLDRSTSRYLVYTSAGKHAQVNRWLNGRKDFDLWITCYDENPSLIGWADYFNERKGGKFPNLHDAMQQWPELFRQYQAIFVSDDDLHISGSSISKLFQIRKQYDLYILQPAFNQTGKLSHKITRATIGSYLRYTNFIEVTCPLFRYDKLEAFMKIYDPTLVCHGVDFWYMQNLIGDDPQKAAIVDAISAYNPHDSSKGGREIEKLQSTKDRLANWERIKSSRKLTAIHPKITWSSIRRYDSPRFYTSAMKTIYSRILTRLKALR